MRAFLTFLAAVFVGAMVYWSYSENYRTRDAEQELRVVLRDLRSARARLAILQDEWAYLNRPSRLRALVEMNEARLGLIPMNPDHFGHIAQVAFPPSPEELSPDGLLSDEITGSVAVSSDGAGQ